MKELFAKRKQDFRQQCLKYLRYVLNDHFVLFLLIFMGFLGVQYSQLLRHFPTNHLPIIASLVILSLFILPFGRIATYLESRMLSSIGQRAEVRAFIKAQILRPISCMQSYRLESYCYWLRFFWLWDCLFGASGYTASLC